MSKPTVHIVIKNGSVEEAYADCDVDLVVYDLDCPDDEIKKEIEKRVEELHCYNEVEIFSTRKTLLLFKK